MDEVHQALQVEIDGYLLFFKRRAEAEQDYAEALSKLSIKLPEPRKSDEEAAPSPLPHASWRGAWDEIRQKVAEEASTHRKLGEDFKGIHRKLGNFREDKDRMRRRVKEDLRAAIQEYSAYVGDVARLSKTYIRKVEELKEGDQVREHEGWPPSHWSDSEGSTGRTRSHSTSSSRGGDPGPHGRESPTPLGGSPPIAPPGAPVFVSGATSTGIGAPSAYRDPPPSQKGVFDAIAKRDWSGEKKSLNSIVRAVGNLAKGDGSGGTYIKPSAVKGAKALQQSSKLKREAEQADRDYRDGIFRLETLRLNRNRMNRSAAKFLSEFAMELSANLKAALQYQVQLLIDVGHKRTAIAEHAVPEVERIDPALDGQMFLPDTTPNEPAPVYYRNAFVGECRTLLIGVSLSDYFATHQTQPVPLIVKRCIGQVEATGLDCEGIYRIPGKLATVQKIVHNIEKDEATFEFDPREDPAAVAGVLKLYLRQLPQPLFQFATADRITLSSDFSKDPEFHLSSISRRIRRLPPAHQATLQALSIHLSRVAEHENLNKMNPMNLGVCFTPVVFGDDETRTLEAAMHSAKDIVMELLISNHKMLFDDSLLKNRPPSRRPSDEASSVSSISHTAAYETSEKRPVPPPPALNTSLPPPQNSRPVPPPPVLNTVLPPSSNSIASPLAISSVPAPKPRPSLGPVSIAASPTSVELAPGKSQDSVFELYRATDAVLLPHARTPSGESDLDAPTPPLSAAEGRHIPGVDSPAASSPRTSMGEAHGRTASGGSSRPPREDAPAAGPA